MRCRFCPQPDAPYKIGHMSFALIESILERTKVIEPTPTVVMNLNGESTLHPRILEIVALVNSLKLRYYFTSNGLKWTRELTERVCNKDSSAYQILFSHNGLYDSTAEVACPGTNPSLVVRNMLDVIDYKRENNASQDVGVKIIDRGQDFQEIEEFIGTWLHHGMDYVCHGKVLITRNKQTMRKYPCRYSDDMFMLIRSNGKITPCGWNNDAITFYDWGYVEPNDIPLMELYNAPIINEWRNDQRRGIFHGPCLECGFAFTGYGWEGVLTPRNQRVIDLCEGRPIYYHEDYFNRFFSFKKRIRKPSHYYVGGHLE